jgi:hypothetical protein
MGVAVREPATGTSYHWPSPREIARMKASLSQVFFGKNNMSVSPTLPRVIDFGRDTCGNLIAAEAREWLVTNGIGGFACGTVAGTLTRRYHGLLVAALPSRWHRTLLVSKIEEVVEYHGQVYALGANRWAGGAIDPSGYLHIERFHLEGTTPVWTFACADALIEKRIWMEHGANTTYVQYTAVRARRATPPGRPQGGSGRPLRAEFDPTAPHGERAGTREPAARALCSHGARR